MSRRILSIKRLVVSSGASRQRGGEVRFYLTLTGDPQHSFWAKSKEQKSQFITCEFTIAEAHEISASIHDEILRIGAIYRNLRHIRN